MTSNQLASSILLTGLLLSAGCYQQPSPPQPVPVIQAGAEKGGGQQTVVLDLDAVARAMGWDQRIQQSVEQATEDLNAQLLKAAQEMDADLKKQQAELGPDPTPEQVAGLRQLKLLVDQKIQSNKVIAQNARDRVRNEQVLLFRNQVRPISGQVARKHGAEVVLMANEEMVWFDAAVDITGEVITEMRTRAASGPVPDPSVDSGETATNRVTPTKPEEEPASASTATEAVQP